MTRRFRSAWVAPVLALLLLPRFAAAGPIGWDFTVTATTDPAADRVYLGEYHYAPPGSPTLHVVTGIPTGGSGTAEGNATNLLIGGTGKQDWETVAAPPAAAATAFTLRFQITDRASGETSGADFVGRPTFVPGAPGTPAGEVVLALDGSGSFVLGGNRYELDVRTVDDGSSQYIYADVSVAAVATPEPGTLALAGFGLAAAGLRLRRRG